jgi:hypothetical protein
MQHLKTVLTLACSAIKYHFVGKANESIFPHSPIKNSDSRFGIKNVNEKSSHPVFWSVKVSSKNRHEQQQTEGNLQPKQRGKPLFSHLIQRIPGL